jgi:hypothetical protein
MSDQSDGTVCLRLSEEEFQSLRDEDAGMCLACGEYAYGVEPDARRYTCECCGVKSVYGLEEALVMGRVEITSGEDE